MFTQHTKKDKTFKMHLNMLVRSKSYEIELLAHPGNAVWDLITLHVYIQLNLNEPRPL